MRIVPAKFPNTGDSRNLLETESFAFQFEPCGSQEFQNKYLSGTKAAHYPNPRLQSLHQLAGS